MVIEGMANIIDASDLFKKVKTVKMDRPSLDRLAGLTEERPDYEGFFSELALKGR